MTGATFELPGAGVCERLNPMAKKIVEVFIRDKRVASYPVVIPLDRNVADSDFIERVVEQMRAGNYSQDDISVARFVVRSVLDRD
jgi:hypothetical protein